MTHELRQMQIRNLRLTRRTLFPIALALAILAGLACGDDDGESGETPTPADSAETATPAAGTPAPPDPELARRIFFDFVDAVLANDVDAAWAMYIASMPGDTSQHNATLGCQYGVLADDMEKMQHMFERLSPFTVDEIFGAAAGSLQIELKLTGADGMSYLATLVREPPSADYRLRFFNSGRVAQQPGVPDPFPSPEDPQGFCGIWTGPR